ncbi:26S proteasome non-ATPase regulatory subunit 10-like, partial [Ceratina calcarata]
MTPLHLAAYEGYDGIVETLIRRGARINAKSIHGTPLHLAAANGHCNIVQFLLDQKARIDVKDGKNRTALELAVAYGRLEVVKILLLPKKVDVNTKYNCSTLLHMSSQELNLEM